MSPASAETFLVRDLERLAPGGVRRDASLAQLSRWRIGGSADVLVEPASVEQLTAVMRRIYAADANHVVVGDTSNLLFDDAGLRGIVVRVSGKIAELRFDKGGLVTAGAGIWVPRFVRQVINHGLSGAVHAIGIPGTLGGLVVMNGGSQRRGIGEHVEGVTILGADGVVRTLDRGQCGFAYRTSVLQGARSVVLEVACRFEPGDAATMRREAVAILSSRRRKFPKELPNCGSVFVSNPAMYAIVGPPGHAIEQVGLKGRRAGNAEISPLHANFINNLGGARAADVLELIRLARNTVAAETGFEMDSEVRYVAPDGAMAMAHEA